ncbi:MAG: NAD(P)-binding protein, partial [Acidimicrobiales bacterium]|nr:NAD(P)-binding protein [Acidimicrobiales bacterium]
MEHLTLHRSAAVVGGGPAGLMAAETMARSGLPVTVY